MLDLIKKHEPSEFIKMMIYGAEKLGKTTFAAKASDPVFILTEEGLGLNKADAFPLVHKSAEILDYLRNLYKEEHGFKTVVIDSIDGLDTIIRSEVEKEYSVADRSYGKDSLLIRGKWLQILGALTFLSLKGMHIILIAHAEPKRFNSPTSDPYDKWSPKISDKANALIKEWCDCIFYVGSEIAVTSSSSGEYKKGESKGYLINPRVLYAQGTAAFSAGNRFNLPEQVPFSFVKIMEMINAQINKEQG